MQSKSKRNSLYYRDNGFTLHSYFLCIGVGHLTIISEHSLTWDGKTNGNKIPRIHP